MLPELADLLDGFELYAERQGVGATRDERAVGAALREAAELARGEERDEVATQGRSDSPPATARRAGSARSSPLKDPRTADLLDAESGTAKFEPWEIVEERIAARLRDMRR